MAIPNYPAAAAVLILSAVYCQGQPAGRTEFEVVSVKRATVGGRGSSLRTPNGTVSAKNVVLPLLIGKAYGVEGFQIAGGPAWLASDRFDIEAKSTGGAAGASQTNAMLQSLLEDRFKLKVHRESKEGSIFELTVAKGGAKLQPLKEGSCAAPGPENRPGPPAPGEKPACGVLRPGVNPANRAITIDAVGASTAILARTLTLMLGRPVYDKTGIAGPVDAFHLEYVREDLAGNAAATDVATEPTGPTIFTALPEQLGLKLESAKGAVEFLVIDHIERPAEN